METGTLSHKRTLKNLQERYDAGILEPNALDSNGLSLVHQFAYDGQVTCFKWLLKHGGSATARSSEGCVAAHYAAAGGHLPILHLLKEEHPGSMDIKDNNSTYPLYIAAQEGQLDVVIWLTKHSKLLGSEPAKDGMTAVHAAAQEGHLDCVRYLIQLANCSPVQSDFSGCTPLHFASAEGHWKVVKWLLEYGGAQADMRDNTGSAAIHLAAEYNRLNVLKTMAKLNISVTTEDDTGRTPLDISNEKGHKECAEFLKEWQKQNSTTAKDVLPRMSLKKVRFDENGEKTDDSHQEKESEIKEENLKEVETDKGYKIEEDYMIIAGQLTHERLEEQLKRNKEEWMKANLVNVEDNDLRQEKVQTKREGKGFKGSRNVGKRSSFKDKNIKYQLREKNNNRDSLSIILGKLHRKKPRGENYHAASLTTGERPRPDLIQSVMKADRNASVGFRRRPSLEFFQDIRSQVKATGFKGNNNNHNQSRSQTNIDGPVTIFQNGTLRSSRDNLNEASSTNDVRGRKNKVQKDRGRAIETSPGRATAAKAVIGIDSDQGGAIDVEKREGLKEVELKEGGTKKEIYQPVIRDKIVDEKTNNQKPNTQRKIKLPKGLMGILPKSNSIPSLNLLSKKDNSKKSEKISSKSNQKENYEYLESRTDLPPETHEHYLIRSLPLPTHGIHRAGGHEKVSFYSYNLTRERKQTSSKWLSVRESFGSFFASLRSKRREKEYVVTDMGGSDGPHHQKRESRKFNIAKSLPIKKRKSISLEHLPNFSSTGEKIQITNTNKTGKSTIKRLSYLQPGYTDPDICKFTSMALDHTLKGKMDSPPTEVNKKQEPMPEESLDFVVAHKDVTGFQLNSLQVNNEDQAETGNALMW